MEAVLLGAGLASAISILVFIVGVGLYRRRLWAWKANWAVMAGVCLLEPLGVTTDPLLYLGLLILLGLAWLWPASIYFLKRRPLFAPDPSATREPTP